MTTQYIPGVTAAGDYTAAANIGRPVAITAAGVVTLVTTGGAAWDGILENNPNTGEAARVACLGPSKARLGATTAAGVWLTPEVTTGDMIAAAGATDYSMARTVRNGVDGELVDVMLGGVPTRPLAT